MGSYTKGLIMPDCLKQGWRLEVGGMKYPITVKGQDKTGQYSEEYVKSLKKRIVDLEKVLPRLRQKQMDSLTVKFKRDFNIRKPLSSNPSKRRSARLLALYPEMMSQ
jgi:hypothetical protein